MSAYATILTRSLPIPLSHLSAYGKCKWTLHHSSIELVPYGFSGSKDVTFLYSPILFISCFPTGYSLFCHLLLAHFASAS